MIISPIAQISNKPASPTRREVLAGCVGLTATIAILYKDIVSLCVCAVLFLASLPQSVVQSQTA
jgi:hypothetical protein